MHGDLNVTVSLLLGFLLTFVRISGIFVFVPLPGAQAGPSAARLAFSLASTGALFPFWPHVEGSPTTAILVGYVAGEAVLGLAAGVAIAWLSEILTLGAQILSVQAGYSFASSFDPNTQADSGILQIFGQLTSGLLFFSLGMDRQVLRAFALSLTKCPPGSCILQSSAADAVLQIGSEVFALALRTALPVVGLLFLADLALGVLGRANSHMQTITLSFPLKMVVALVVFASVLSVVPTLYSREATRVMEAVTSLVTSGGYVGRTH